MSLPDLRTGLLKPDNVRGISLDLDQYYLECLGYPLLPTNVRCFDTLPQILDLHVLHSDFTKTGLTSQGHNLPVLTECEILRNLHIVPDADRPKAARGAIGVSSSEGRKI